MNKKCYVCGKNLQVEPNLCFRKFTEIPERKRIWLSLLGFQENHQLPKGAMVCSDHFYPKDIYIGRKGSPIIRQDAEPKFLDVTFNRVSSRLGTCQNSPNFIGTECFNKTTDLFKKEKNGKIENLLIFFLIEKCLYSMEEFLASSSAST